MSSSRTKGGCAWNSDRASHFQLGKDEHERLAEEDYRDATPKQKEDSQHGDIGEQYRAANPVAVPSAPARMRRCDRRDHSAAVAEGQSGGLPLHVQPARA